MTATPDTHFALSDGRQIRRLGYGAMRLCGPGVWGFHADRRNHLAVLHRARDLGVHLFDTSDAYGPDVNEYQIAEALHPYDGLLIATKGGLTRNGPNHWGRDGRPDRLSRCLRNSLRRLEVETIDLYQLHAPDPNVPFEDSVGRLFEEQKAGLIRHVGLSNVTADQLRTALSLGPIVTVQNRYNLTDRSSADVLAVCEEHHVGFLPWYPLAAGELARPGAVLDRVAQKHGCTHAQAALAWLLARSPVMLPIPGTSSVAHLEANMQAEGVQLDAQDMAELEAAA